MASEFSFDAVSRVDMAEVGNAMQQVAKEVATRFDLRGTRAAVDLDAKTGEIAVRAEDGQQMNSLLELVQQRLARRGVSLKAVEVGKAQPSAGGTLLCILTFLQGIPAERAKALSKALRDSGLKVTAQIQGDHLRVAGPKKDDLQAAMAVLKQHAQDIELQFVNYR